MSFDKKRTAFEKDINSEKKELFLEVREFLLEHILDVKEDCKENITSYKTKLGMYCYIKVKNDYIHIGWGRGAKLGDPYNVLFGNGSVVRGQKVLNLDKKTKSILKDFIDQTTIILIENNELKSIRKIY